MPIKIRLILAIIFIFVGCSGSNKFHTLTPEQRAEETRIRNERLSALISQGKITFKGGDGSSFENAITIDGVSNEKDGIATEYLFITSKHGQQNLNWKRGPQYLLDKDKRSYDELEIILAKDSSKIDYFFDITNFFGKREGMH